MQRDKINHFQFSPLPQTWQELGQLAEQLADISWHNHFLVGFFTWMQMMSSAKMAAHMSLKARWTDKESKMSNSCNLQTVFTELTGWLTINRRSFGGVLILFALIRLNSSLSGLQLLIFLKLHFYSVPTDTRLLAEVGDIGTFKTSSHAAAQMNVLSHVTQAEGNLNRSSRCLKWYQRFSIFLCLKIWRQRWRHR